MSGNTLEKQKDQSASIETVENSSNSRDTEVALSNLSTGVEKGALEQDVMLTQIGELLPKYTALRTGIEGAEGNRKTREQLEDWLDENIENLKNMQNDLQKIKYSNLDEYKARLGELIYFYEHYEQVRQIVTLGGRTSDIHAIIDSEQDAKKARRYEKQDKKYQERMNKILHETSLTSLRNNDMERYEEYLESVVNGQVEPHSHPFYKAHEQSFNRIKALNPTLYQTLVPSGAGRVQYVVPVAGRIETPAAKRATTQPESFTSRLGKGFGDVLSNIFPSIENNPKQKEAREQFGAVAALGGSIFMGYKMLKNLFSKKENNPNKRGKTLGWGAALLAFVNGDKIIKGGKNRVQDAFNRHPAEKIQASNELFQKYGFSETEALQIAEMHIGAPVATLSALHFIPIYELNAQRIVEYKNNEFKFNYDNYKKYIDKYDWTAEQKKIVLAAGEKLNKDNSIDTGLNMLGVQDQNIFNELANGSKTKTLADDTNIQKRYFECAENVGSGVNSELYQRGLKAKDVESAKKIIEEYNSGQDIDELIKKREAEGLLEVVANYPMVRMLSDLGINFEANEISKTESWLKSIQDGMKSYAVGVEGYKPYSIEGNKLIFTTSNTASAQKLRIPDDVQASFPNQNRTLDDYPSISKNKDKFLEFMNNEKNKMWGKEISKELSKEQNNQ